ncbi:MAG: transposase family protein, partial [Azoarcus sp.]|nr:transposase family protein [Azoarcus sp.]
MEEVKIKGLIEWFADLPGKRVVGRTTHDLLDIVVIALCAVMSGAQGW